MKGGCKVLCTRILSLGAKHKVGLTQHCAHMSRDREVAQEVIKEIAQSHAPSTAAGGLFKVIVLNEVDKMSRDAQAALRRTMEKYTSACRFILVCNNACKVSVMSSKCHIPRMSALLKYKDVIF